VILLALLSHFVSIPLWSYFIVAGLWFIIVLRGSFLISSNYHVKAFCSNQSAKKNEIALTFDDGPHPNTLLILDTLKMHHVKATFFCIGRKLEENPQILQRIIDEGHIVGNHSYSHSHFFDFFRKKKVIEELNRTDNLLERYTKSKIKYFRPPYGVTTPSIRRALEVTGHHVIGWNIRSLDTLITERAILRRLRSRISPGGIILLHDTKLQTAKALENLLDYLHNNKYDIVPLEQLLNIKAYEN